MTEEQIANVNKWVAALRSGKYQQGVGSLNRNEKYCCLGVLADINNIPNEKIFGGTIVSYKFPIEIYNISPKTIPNEWWSVHTGLPHSLKSQLIHMNDTDIRPFADIANRIESELS